MSFIQEGRCPSYVSFWRKLSVRNVLRACYNSVLQLIMIALECGFQVMAVTLTGGFVRERPSFKSALWRCNKLTKCHHQWCFVAQPQYSAVYLPIIRVESQLRLGACRACLLGELTKASVSLSAGLKLCFEWSGLCYSSREMSEADLQAQVRCVCCGVESRHTNFFRLCRLNPEAVWKRQVR